MKTRIAIFSLLFLIIIWLMWWKLHQPVSQVPRQPDATATNQNERAQVAARPIQATSVVSLAYLLTNVPASNDKRLNQMKEDAEKALNDWRTPIEFYGKVVDENTNPVSGAQIDFDANDTSAEGTSFYHTQSDADGLFSIKNIQGKILGVKVNKEGYYS